jgi:CubicO group peptidase (beta-lactamase class C family)
MPSRIIPAALGKPMSQEGGSKRPTSNAECGMWNVEWQRPEVRQKAAIAAYCLGVKNPVVASIFQSVPWLLLLLFSFGLAAGETANEVAIEKIAGLWGSERVFASGLRGELVVETRGSEWRAKIGGAELPVKREKDAISFNSGEDKGEFRGRMTADSKKIVGHWIQPITVISGNRYATPVELVKSGDTAWRGKVKPMQDAMSFYLLIERAADGSDSAIFRNPERNYLGKRSYRVEVRGSEVVFSNTQKAEDQIRGTFDARTGHLSIRFADFPEPFDFTRRDNATAAGFFPRAKQTANYVYQKPAGQGDGWETGALGDAGVDEKILAPLIQKILTADPRDNPLNIHSLLIARHGKLVFEEYFYGFDRDRLHDMRSASKTFAPFLVGIARDRGAHLEPETPVCPLFPEYSQIANQDARKDKMTVENLMTMTSGLACNDDDENSPGNEDVMQSQTAQKDWYKYTLDLPMVAEPGGDHAVYCSAGINLLGGIVRNATKTWLPDFFYENVAAPLQFRSYHLNLMPTGDGYMGGGLYLRPRDQLKLGQLYLSGGVWNGRRVVSKEWVERSVAHHSMFEPTFGVEHEYGYGWHIRNLKVGDRTFRDYGAGGNGGQLVIVVPELDLVVGITGGSYSDFKRWGKWELELLPQYIIPAVLGKPMSQ